VVEASEVGFDMFSQTGELLAEGTEGFEKCGTSQLGCERITRTQQFGAHCFSFALGFAHPWETYALAVPHLDENPRRVEETHLSHGHRPQTESRGEPIVTAEREPQGAIVVVAYRAHDATEQVGSRCDDERVTLSYMEDGGTHRKAKPHHARTHAGDEVQHLRRPPHGQRNEPCLRGEVQRVEARTNERAEPCRIQDHVRGGNATTRYSVTGEPHRREGCLRGDDALPFGTPHLRG